LQRSYKDLEDLSGLTRDQIKKSLQRLEKLGLIKRVFRNIKSQSTNLSNVMFIEINVIKIAEITEKKLNVSFNTHTYGQKNSDGKVYLPIHTSENTQTYTETTTQITTNSTLSQKTKDSEKLNQKEIFEREKEMISIWDKTIRENETSSTCSKARLLSLKKSLENYFNDDLKEWAEYCLKIKNNNFLMGGGINGWKADLTWATKEENLIRVLDGAYQKKEISTQQGTKSIASEIEEESSSDSIWNNTKAILKNRVGESSYKSWFSKLRIAGYDEDKAIITAPSNFVKQWVLDHYLRDIVESFKQIEPQINNVEILIKA
jgi:hypothetical protein